MQQDKTIEGATPASTAPPSLAPLTLAASFAGAIVHSLYVDLIEGLRRERRQRAEGLAADSIDAPIKSARLARERARAARGPRAAEAATAAEAGAAPPAATTAAATTAAATASTATAAPTPTSAPTATPTTGWRLVCLL